MALGAGIRRLFRIGGWRAVERDVDDEVAFHIDARTAELVARGAEPAAAREAALREFGDVAAARAELGDIDRARLRGARRAEWWEATWQDARYAARGLVRQPGFALVVVLTLALGIGANAAMFGVVDHLLFRSPPGLRDAGELRRLYFTGPGAGGERTRSVFNYPEFHDLSAAAARGGYQLAGYSTRQRTLAGGGGAAGGPVRAGHVTTNFFALLGVRPALGRFFDGDEGSMGDVHRVAVLDYGFWRRHFGGSSAALGAQLTLGKERYTVIGVAPPGFAGIEYQATDVWLPFSTFDDWQSEGKPWYATRNYYMLQPIARVPPGGDARAAAAATTAYRGGDPGDARVEPTGRVSLASLIKARGPEATDREVGIATRLGGVSLAVLLIACANVANLLLARAMRRRREVAVRLALGVSRGRLARQLLTEGVLLAALGGAAALLIAAWGGQAMRALLFPDQRWVSPPVDGRVLGFSAAAALAVGLLAALAPAIQSTRPDLTASLRDEGRARQGGRSRLRAALLVAQTALSLVLLAGAGLFVRSLQAVRAQDLGYDADRLIGVEAVPFGDERPDAVAAAVTREAAERVRALPGVERVGLAALAPIRTWTVPRLYVPGWDSLPRLDNEPQLIAADPDYFAAMGMRLRHGRTLADADRAGAPPVVVVNERIARFLWPNQDAIGKCFRIGKPDSPCRQVVGVVADAHFRRLVEEPKMQYFVPLEQWQDGAPRAMIVRAGGDATLVASLIRAELKRMPGLNPSATAVYTFAEHFGPQLRPWRLGASLFGLFGLLALVVAAVGCYSVLAYAVSQRTHEMGIRVALGARTGDVLRLVVGEGVRVTALGVVLGVACALAAGRLVASLLFGTSPRDPAVLAGASIVLLVVAVAASLIPAWRAARVDPTTALRTD